MSTDAHSANALNRLTFRLLYVVFMILIASVAALLLPDVNQRLRFVEQEKSGVVVLAELRGLLEHLLEYRDLCTIDRRGKISLHAQCLEAEQPVDREFGQLLQLNDHLINTLEMQGRVKALQEHWQILKKRTFELPAAELFSEHTALIGEITALIQYVANSSNLILDPVFETYYLMDIAVNRLPPLFESIGQIRGTGSGVMKAGHLNDPAKLDLMVQIEQARLNSKSLYKSLSHVSGKAADQTGEFNALADKTLRQSAQFIDLAESRLLSAHRVGDDVVSFFDAGSRALAANFQFYNVVLKQLDTMLEQRLSGDKSTLVQAIVAVVVVLLLVSTLFLRQRALMQQLETGEIRWKSIFNTALNGRIVIDEEGLIKDFNPAAKHIFGYRHEEMIGRNISLLMPEPDRSHHDGYLRHYLETGDKAIIGKGREVEGLRKDGTVFPMELAVSVSVVGGKRIFNGIVSDVSQRKQAETALDTHRRQIETINGAQSRFIAGGDPIEFFEGILPDILELTQSEFGLIGEAMVDPDGAPYLKAYALSNIAWDEATREFYEKNAPEGLEFRSLDNLFGKVILSGKQVISNDPVNDSRSAGIPDGHPPLKAFLGVPVYMGSTLLGMVGLANRPGGYDEATIERLRPVLSTCAQIFNAIGRERQQRRTALELKRSNSFMAALIENLQAGLLVEDEAGKIYALNQTYCDMFGKDDMPLMLEGRDCALEFEHNQHLFREPEALLQRRQECLSKQTVITGQEMTLCDGRVFEQDYVPIIFEDEKGQLHRSHLWSYRNISEQKQLLAQIEQQSQALERTAADEHILGELLRAVVQPTTIEEYLEHVFEIMFRDVPWLQFQANGAIFLTEDKGHRQCLYLATSHNLAPSLQTLCAEVPFGYCLCGRTAADRRIQFGYCDENCFEAMELHGYYSVPLLQEDTVLGAMLFHPSHNYPWSDAEEAFLSQVADIVAMGIGRRYAHDALRNAKIEAEQSAMVKSQFLATMSHEIRTPMNGVLGMLHLLGKTNLNATQRRFMDTATGSGEMLLTVINDILDFSKLEADKIELESIPFDLEILMEQSVSLLAEGAQGKGIELLCSVDSGIPNQLKGDPTRLRQVLTNLINNAIKFTEQGEIVVYVSKQGNYFHFGVRDTGIGMSETQQQHLFKAFSQVDSSHTRKFGGTGLGLAISQKLIKAMGGEIRVASTPGKGSDFSFDLLLEVAGDGKSKDRFSVTLAKRRFLVVDDNPELRELLKNILESWQVTHIGLAEGGGDALAQLREAVAVGEPYDIAIVDKRMPDMDGLKLVCAIRADAAFKEMSLMMLSANCQDEPVPELDAWLTKPILQSELFNTLLRLLGEQPEGIRENHIGSKAQEWWFGGSKLLLVEDNHVNQEVAREILGEAGFDIDVRNDGAEAVQAVQESRYDVVLMDIQMPVMDGLEATRQIRTLGRHYVKLPIIAMTAHALSGDADKSLDTGMNGHLTKPIDPAAMFRELARWVTPGEKPPAVEKQKPEMDIEPLPRLPGIDVTDGLQRLNGNWVTYKRILQGFRDKQADAADRLEAFIRQGNWEEAARLAHALKGNGGNLGATQLYEAAVAVEQACRKADADAVIGALASLRMRLAEVISGLVRLDTHSTTEEAAPVEHNPIAWNACLDKLQVFLDSDLGKAQACLISLRNQAAGSGYLASLGELENALNDFDIDAAKNIAQRLQAQ